ncbi:HAD-IIB family hydrolase [uncultured Clostridium sp.]|uniref:HAD-IIB family hydrolase n=1 Tax=uncultured Clostridium sp. TaxID=59620 RepID=UPI002609C746|nr:HAD-IIB family hydrolase [uncultured Clostridium sp.]
MKKLLASDLDGTLILKDKISEKDILAVNTFREKGGIFTVSTGRPMNGVRNIEKENNIIVDYFILLNGAYVLNSKKEVLRHLFINKDIAREIVDGLGREKKRIGIDTGESTYLFGSVEDFPFENAIAIEDFSEIKEDISVIAMDFENTNIEKLEEIKDGLIKKYGKYVEVYRNTKYIDIVPIGCSKGTGVELIADITDIESKDIFTIGDSFNDTPMFEITENSFTFHRAEIGVKEIAQNLVEDVSECIRDYILV